MLGRVLALWLAWTCFLAGVFVLVVWLMYNGTFPAFDYAIAVVPSDVWRIPASAVLFPLLKILGVLIVLYLPAILITRRWLKRARSTTRAG